MAELEPPQDDIESPGDRVAERRRALSVGAVAVIGAIVAAILIATQWPNANAGTPILPVTSGADVVNGTPGTWAAGPTAPGLTGAFSVFTGTQILAGPVGYKARLNPWKVFVYDVATKKWHTVLGPTGLAPRIPFATVWDGTDLLFLGGWIAGPASRGGEFTSTTTNWAFNPTTSKWHTIPDLPASPEQTMTAVWTGTEVIAFSGGSHTFVYTPSTNAWVTRDKFPGGQRAGSMVSWAGTHLYVWGGLVNQKVVRSGYRFDPHTGTWSAMPLAPVGEENAATVWTGGQLFVYGGTETTDGGVTTTQDPAAYSFDPSSDEWQTLPALPFPGLVGATATWTGNALLVWGRQPAAGKGVGPAAGAAYDPLAGTWRTLSSASDIAGPGSHAFWTGQSMAILGGWPKGETVNGSSANLAEWTPAF